MKIIYTIILTLSFWNLVAQGIDMDFDEQSPSITLKAKYDSIEKSKGEFYPIGGDATINLMRTDSSRSANINFDLMTQKTSSDYQTSVAGDIIKEEWSMGVEGDDKFRFVHHTKKQPDGIIVIIDLDGEEEEIPKVDVLILDADEEGSHEAPIVQIPQGRLHIGDDIKLSTSSENQLLISGGSVVPNVSLTGLGISGYDLGKDGLFSHWDDVVANDFITYSFFPEIVLAKSNISSLDVLEGIKTYKARNMKDGENSRMMLNPKELKKVFPEALHLQDVKHYADGTTEIIEIENPGIIYDRFIPLLIDGMREQKELIDKQADYIESIEARLAKLEKE